MDRDQINSATGISINLGGRPSAPKADEGEIETLYLMLVDGQEHICFKKISNKYVDMKVYYSLETMKKGVSATGVRTCIRRYSCKNRGFTVFYCTEDEFHVDPTLIFDRPKWTDKAGLEAVQRWIYRIPADLHNQDLKSILSAIDKAL